MRILTRLQAILFPDALKPFCDEHCVRYKLDEPFVIKGYEYATDGRIAVRRRTLKPETRRDFRIPNADRIFENIHDDIGPWKRMLFSKFGNLEERHTCPECFGRRIQLDKYPPMDSYGEIRNPNRYPNYDVDDNTIGDKSCNRCRGEGDADRAVHKIDGAAFSLAYLLKTQMFWFPEYRMFKTSEGDVIFFRSRIMGLEGILMSLSLGRDV